MKVPLRPLQPSPLSSQPLIQVTPFPNILLDQVMPTLKDTEWRVLCVIVRQTLGWQDGSGRGQRKQSDWLSHQQLKRRTGRNSEAICRAIVTLVEQDLIQVRNSQGQLLMTSQARQRACGQLYFGLSARQFRFIQPTSPGEKEIGIPKSEIRKAKTTKESNTKI